MFNKAPCHEDTRGKVVPVLN